jgi:hypothetical protein
MSDGTAAGTVLVGDIAPDAISSAPHGLVEADGLLAFFAADDAQGGRGIWATPLPNGIFPAEGTTWSLTGPAGAQTLTVTGGGLSVSAEIANHYPNLSINVSAGGVAALGGGVTLNTLTIGAGGRANVARGTRTTLVLDALTIDVAGGGKLDLADNKLVVRNGDRAAIEGYIAAAYNASNWNGVGGILTSMPDAGPLTGTGTVAVLPASQYFFGPFGGVSVGGSDVLVMYSYAGDLNLDGRVDAQDYGTIDNWVQFPGTDGYWNGDINFDGVIDAVDYGIIDNAIQLQGPPL